MRKLIVISMLYIALNIALVANLPLVSLLPATGAILALNSMALSLLLAARFKFVDYILGGPDKSYKLHRYLGYIAVVALGLHWATANNAQFELIPAFAEFAEETGEFAAFAIVALALVSALKFIPYHLWKKSHLMMGPLFLISVFHSFFSASPIAFNTFAWWLVLIFSCVGTIGWLKTLFNNKKKPISATVTAISRYRNTIDIQLDTSEKLISKAGQFAAISVNKTGLKEQHPFSIASANGAQKMRFIIKDAGDYTHQLVNNLHTGDSVLIHEIAGKFLPQTQPSRQQQIWLAAGTGITPFLAALASMQSDDAAKIDLIFAAGYSINPDLLQELTEYEQQLSQFTFHVLPKNERLNIESFNKTTSHWRSANLYICGASSIKHAAVELWKINHATGRVYTEAFDFRGAYDMKWLLICCAKKMVINKACPNLVQRARDHLPSYKNMSFRQILLKTFNKPRE